MIETRNRPSLPDLATCAIIGPAGLNANDGRASVTRRHPASASAKRAMPQASNCPAFAACPLITIAKAWEHNRRRAGFPGASLYRFQEISMKTKLLTTALVAASLFAPAVAFAQSESSPPSAATESKAAPEAKAKPRAMHHSMKSSHSTVGMSSRSTSTAKSRPGGEPVSRKTAD
jgi:hypothetical protein